MPAPHPSRDRFLKYLRQKLPHEMPWVDASDVYDATEVRKAIVQLSQTDQNLHRILDHFMRTKMARMRIAELTHYDSSTVKRKLDEAVDVILQNLKMNRLLVNEALKSDT